MVEANPDAEQYEMEEEKTFLEEPAILDKYKAAAVITDGKQIIYSFKFESQLSSCPVH